MEPETPRLGGVPEQDIFSHYPWACLEIEDPQP